MGNRLNTAIGPTPLALNHADNGEIESLVQYGKCEQKPVDYLATVTQTGICEQRNLPKGYVELTYLQSNGTQLLQLDLTRQSGKSYVMQADIEASVFGPNSSGMFTLGSDYAGYCVVSRKWNTTDMVMLSGSVQSSGLVYTGRATYTVSVATDGLTCTLSDGTNTASYTRTTTNYDNKPILFGLNSNYKGSVKIYSAKLWEDDVLKFDLVPSRNAGGVCGMYNKVDGSFIAPLVGTLVAGDAVTPTPDAPMDIVCNNGALKVSLNLANMVSDNIVVGKYINNSGVETADTANFFYAPYVPVTPSGTYTMATSSSIWYFSVMQYDSSKTFLRRTIWGASNTPVGTEKTFSVGADCAYIRFGSNMRKSTISLADVLAVNWMLTQTDTVQPYRPYKEIYFDGTPEVITDVNGNTATAVNLFGIGSASDTQEFLSGAVGRQVGVYVFTGEEAFTVSASEAMITVIPDVAVGADNTPINTHFALETSPTSITNGTQRFGANGTKIYSTNYYMKHPTITTVPDFQAWLAAQYAAGTPVIVLYPLATPTTESVTGQMLVKAPLTVTAEVTVPTLATTTAAVSTPDPFHPLPVWCNNGKLTKSANLVDVNGQTPVNLAYSANKLVTNAERYGYYINVKPNTKYTISINRSRTGAYLNICDTTSVPANNVSVQAYNTMDGTTASKTITTKANTNYLYVYTAYVSGYHPFENGDFQIEEGASASVYHPFVYADGTPEVLTVSGANLANMVAENIGVGKIIYDNGSVSNSAVNFVYNKYIPVEAGQNYVLYGRRKSDNAISAYNRICWYTANKGWISRATYTKDTIGSAVAPNNAAYARFTVAPVDNSDTLTLDDVLDFNWTFAKATEEIPYQPYVAPQTASVVDLLGLTENYRDTHELVHGIKTGVVGVMVLTGDEGDWVKTTSGDRVMFYRNSNLTSAASVTTSSGIILCTIATHRSNSWTPISSVIVQRSNKNFGLMNPEGFTVDSTVDDWTNYLKAKYAAGDSVMIFYPLASSIISQTTPQSLYTTNGTNIISLTAEINDIQLDCKYLPFPTIVSLILRRRLLKKYLTPSVVGYGRVGFTQTI